MGPEVRKGKKAEPWYAKGLRFECTRCGNCCVGDGRYVFVYPDLDETFRIAGHLGIAREDFVGRFCEMVEGVLVFRSDTDHCVFLGDGGCTIYPVRPRQCLTWPFWKSNLKSKEWNRFLKARCPGIGHGRIYSREDIDEAAKEWAGALDGVSEEE